MIVASYLKNYVFRLVLYKIGKFFRRLNLSDPAFRKLQHYRNKYAGKRCFIIATGPSLTLEDVRKLKNEITFGMNSICMLFDKLGWETTFYGVQDPYVYEKMKNGISSLKDSTLLVGDIVYQSSKCNAIPFSVNYLNHRHTYKKLMTKFSSNPSLEVYDGYTITYSLMQIAAYMGFKEIYLLGNDCSYSSDPKKQHFADFGHVDPTAVDARRRILFSYQVAKDYADRHNFTIYNATRGGQLEIFQRVDFDTLFESP